ncbi:MAG: hypothetical protein NVS9B4_01010 [Candidatus Acidiferrum sp.]
MPDSTATEYRFVGSDTEVTHLAKTFTSFGDRVTLQGGAEEAAAIDGPFIPEAAFAACGFTDDELLHWSNAADHESAPQEFRDKKHKALLALYDLQHPPAHQQTPAVPAPTGAPEGVVA